MADEMKLIVDKAKRRRAKLLKELTDKKWTITKLAGKYEMTPARMGQLIKKARGE